MNEISWIEIFIERLRSLMSKNNLSISKLAEKTGIPRTAISNWLNRRRKSKSKHLYVLAKYFDCSTDYLLGLEDEFGNKQR